MKAKSEKLTNSNGAFSSLIDFNRWFCCLVILVEIIVVEKLNRKYLLIVAASIDNKHGGFSNPTDSLFDCSFIYGLVVFVIRFFHANMGFESEI